MSFLTAILVLMLAGATSRARAETVASPSTEEIRKLHGITAHSETHYSIKRASIEKRLEGPSGLAKEARAVRSVDKDGKPEGWKLFAIRAVSTFAALGLRNGDKVISWDGTPLTSKEIVLTKYSELRTAKRAELGIIRAKKSVTLRYDIVD